MTLGNMRAKRRPLSRGVQLIYHHEAVLDAGRMTCRCRRSGRGWFVHQVRDRRCRRRPNRRSERGRLVVLAGVGSVLALDFMRLAPGHRAFVVPQAPICGIERQQDFGGGECFPRLAKRRCRTERQELRNDLPGDLFDITVSSHGE
jgi:hypothetical protein